MADEEEEDGGDYLEQEKERDHLEKITEYMKEDLKLRKQQAANAPPYVVGRTLTPVNRPLHVSARKIGNGWILAVLPEGHYGGYGDETFCQTAGELGKAAAALVEAFTKEMSAVAAPSGPPPLYMEPGEAI